MHAPLARIQPNYEYSRFEADLFLIDILHHISNVYLWYCNSWTFTVQRRSKSDALLHTIVNHSEALHERITENRTAAIGATALNGDSILPFIVTKLSTGS